MVANGKQYICSGDSLYALVFPSGAACVTVADDCVGQTILERGADTTNRFRYMNMNEHPSQPEAKPHRTLDWTLGRQHAGGGYGQVCAPGKMALTRSYIVEDPV